MNATRRLAPFFAVFGLSLAVAACGGGGTSSGGGGTVPSAPTSDPTANATSTPGITGSLAIGNTPAANATVVYSCGCSAQAGETMTDASGNYAITPTATAIPQQPTPTYTTVPGRNYMIIGFASSGAQAWTMEFLGNTPATDLNLASASGSGNSNVSDAASAAASLYIYYESGQLANADQSFDNWNFNTIAQWAAHLRAGTGLSAHETTFMSDVASAQSSGKSMYPSIPVWNPQAGATVNSAILTDIENVHADGTAVDPALPTPCPAVGQCTGAPSP